ncbi:MAG: biotin synthase [Desulfonauticus sp.]|nr:biotin synthase [Desulfonauticus sp.]
MFSPKDSLHLAEKALQNKLSSKDLETLSSLKGPEILSLLTGSNFLRQLYSQQIHLCTIANAKSGRCSENCAFCAQSKYYQTHIPVYPLKPKEELYELGQDMAQKGVNRYALVTSGKALTSREIMQVKEVFASLKSQIGLCASLGILSARELEELKRAGLSRYHHNLETSKSYFPRICTTHSYAERINTIKEAKKAGLSVCSGGVFGLGESFQDIIELAYTLKELDVDAVPLNFLIPIPGTPLEKNSYLTPLYCLKIIATFRFILPDKEIIICGGRKQHLSSLHPLIFLAGASAIMTGNYLTQSGFSVQEDLEFLKTLGLSVRRQSV